MSGAERKLATIAFAELVGSTTLVAGREPEDVRQPRPDHPDRVRIQVDEMTEYLDELDAVKTPNPEPRAPIRRILAAYGPKMLELARDRSAGAHTYHVNVAHTARAREISAPTHSWVSNTPWCSSPTPAKPAQSRASTYTPT